MPDVAAAQARGRFSRRQKLGIAAVVAAMSLAAALALIGLDNHLFWDDEANTAIYARNLLNLGRMTAWDGRNLVGYGYGGALGEDLGKELRVPSLPAYVAAAGMWLCGQTTFGGRIMFVLAGIASVGLLAAWTRCYLGPRSAWYLPSLVLALSPAYLLYIRNCRYYALGVMFTLLLLVFWTPAAKRPLPGGRWYADRRVWLRWVGGAVAMVCLLWSHYLNAAAALAILPLFFLDRRFRNRQQLALWGVVCGVTLLYGLWVLATANPFAAKYEIPSAVQTQLGENPTAGDWAGLVWERFYSNLGWFLRDLGTHEFFPWCLVPVLALPWLIRSRRLRAGRLRRMAQRGAILVVAAVVYVAVASGLTPLDMGHGPVAEIRYVVPLIAVGAAMAGVALTILWRAARPVAIVALLLLLATNYLHLGFLAQRGDRTKPWWPPTTYRYLVSIFNDFQTGNDQLIEMLRQLPPGTTVRLSPGYMAYPAMFYVPELHYCDQLGEDKRIRPELRRELPDYLFKDRVEPEVWLASSRILGNRWRELEGIEGFGTLDEERQTGRYQVKTTLSLPDRYQIKPEVPTHFFAPWQQDWVRYFFMVALVLDGSELSEHPVMAVDAEDADALCRLGAACAYVGQESTAMGLLEQGLQVDPDHAELHFKLGQVLMHRTGAHEDEQAIQRAARQFEMAARLAPHEHWRALGSLGSARIKQGRLRNAQGRLAEARQCMQQARTSLLAALAIKPDWPMAYFNLGYIAKLEGDDARAIERFRHALEVGPKYVPAHVNWGAILFERGQIDEAMAHYRTALEIAPKHLQAHYALGQALLARSQQKKDAGDDDGSAADRAEGIEHLRTALAMIPQDSDMAVEIRRTFREDLGVEP